MKRTIKLITNLQKTMPDLVLKKCPFYCVCFIDSLCSADKINDYILKKPFYKSILLERNIAGPNTFKIKESEIYKYLSNGFAIVFNKFIIYAVEVRANINRGIDLPTSEPSLTGPKDAFTENYQINIGLIKRRIKDKNLGIWNASIGKRTDTNIGVLYIDDIVNKDLLENVKKKLSNIHIDGIVDSADLALLLQLDDKSDFPTIIKTERPDVTAKALLDGKIVISVDTSCYALIIPGFFVDFLNPRSDDYSKSPNINFIKILRVACFLISMIAPAFYIAIINYNQETIPTSLLVNFSIQRDGVPFPAIIEAIIMIVLCEILRESDLRFPNSYGSAISILGALILGEAAVSAGIVSPIMIIVVAFTFITSLVFNEYELINCLRHYRFIFLLGAAIYGILGIVFAGIVFLADITSVYTFDKPYFFPLAPFEYTYFSKTFLKNKTGDDLKRSKMLSKNKIKQRRNK